MELLFYKDYYAPKIFDMTGSIHAIYSAPCNFNCRFCAQSKRNENVKYVSCNRDQFRIVVLQLLKSSDMFKFTGGEPTVLPEILDMMRIVKEHSGKVFLDSNGSNFTLIKKAVDDGLVDVLGVSIKGLNKEEAVYRAGIRNPVLSWDNVIQSCNYSFEKDVKVILTYVVNDRLSLPDLDAFCDRIDEDINIHYFKLNNVSGKDLPDPECRPLSREKLDDCIDHIVTAHPKLKNRLIIIDDFDAVRKKEAIRYF